MGNNQSRGESGPHPPPAQQPAGRTSISSNNKDGSISTSISTTLASSEPRAQPGRRPSISALQTGRGEPAAPAASLASAEYKHSSTTSSANSIPSVGRIGTSGSIRPVTASSQKSATGQWTPATPHTVVGDASTSPSEAHKGAGIKSSGQTSRNSSSASHAPSHKGPDAVQATKDVLESPPDMAAGSAAESDPETPLSPEQIYALPPASVLSRPPRLPLPIQEEDFQPGSPIIPATELSDEVMPLGIDSDGVARTRSETTMGDEDFDDDIQAVGDLPGEGIGPKIPTVIEWKGTGEKVYVTGTFAGWDRKYRLQRNGPSQVPGALSATIHLNPGTHHLNFIVDGEMRLSTDLPTAVDFTNFLVNYIEVLPAEQSATALSGLVPGQTTTESAAGPIDIKPGAGAGHTSGQADTAVKPHVRTDQPPEVVPGVTGQVLPPGELRPVPQGQTATTSPGIAVQDQQPQTGTMQIPAAATAKIPKGSRIPEIYYHSVVPAYLYDLDHEAEGSEAQMNALSLADTLPAPPSLPMFFSKSVLNGAMPMKDDASVLIMPNHTVLNHLATSSIRQGVLATSATTRYRQKFLTTIIYKPTNEGVA